MRIAVIAPGSRGDVEPYLALGQGLVNAGHSVRLVTHEDFETLVRAHGVEFWPARGRVQDIVQSASMRQRLASGSFVSVLRQMQKDAEAGARELASASLAACEGMEMLLAGVGGLYVAVAIAEKLKLPLLQAYYIPFAPTRAYPSFLMPQLPANLSGAANRLSHHLARQMMWQAFRPADRLLRREILDLPRAPFAGPYRSETLRGLPILYGFSPAVIPPPADGEDIHVTGYWFPESSETWTPPAALADFLAAGPPPVYVGFGSMSSSDPAATAAMILDALARAGQRGLILAGWGGLQATALPDSVMMIDSVPFGWLFPHMAAVVHHGGAGTTAAGLRAGVPSIVVPFFGDQPFWGRRVADLGVGPAPISRQKLSAARLGQAIATAVSDPALRRRAAELGARIRAEDGVANAVAIIEQRR